VKINYKITSEYLQEESFRKSGHKGIDLLMKNGTELRSVCDGKIHLVDYGNINVGKGVFVKCENGNTTIFGHLSKFAENLKEGDYVHAGDLIGYSGNSGHVVGKYGGYHLHFGLKDTNGNFINPEPYVNSLQNMNNPQWISSHTGSVNEIGDTLQTMSNFSLSDIMSQYMKDYASMLSEIKFNFINLITSIDYSMLIHHLQHLFQFFS
jgi:hypothetical protein